MTVTFAVPPGVAPAWDAVVLRNGEVVFAGRWWGRGRGPGRCAAGDAGREAAALRRVVAHEAARHRDPGGTPGEGGADRAGRRRRGMAAALPRGGEGAGDGAPAARPRERASLVAALVRAGDGRSGGGSGLPSAGGASRQSRRGLRAGAGNRGRGALGGAARGAAGDAGPLRRSWLPRAGVPPGGGGRGAARRLFDDRVAAPLGIPDTFFVEPGRLAAGLGPCAGRSFAPTERARTGTS